MALLGGASGEASSLLVPQHTLGKSSPASLLDVLSSADGQSCIDARTTVLGLVRDHLEPQALHDRTPHGQEGHIVEADEVSLGSPSANTSITCRNQGVQGQWHSTESFDAKVLLRAARSSRNRRSCHRAETLGTGRCRSPRRTESSGYRMRRIYSAMAHSPSRQNSQMTAAHIAQQ